MARGTFAEAIRCYEAHRNDRGRATCGIGFMFSETDNYCCIDLDDLFKEGKLEAAAAQVVDELDSYPAGSPKGLANEEKI
jgi:primase-polymerase (primpol)-like protein